MESESIVISTPQQEVIEGNSKSRNGRTRGPTRRSTRGQWTPEEDEILRKAVHNFQGKNWKKIAEYFKDRTDVQCLHRWQKVLNPELIKGSWTKEEDEMIVQLIQRYGTKNWSTIARFLPGRIGKQCRERWHNHLNPAIKKEAWTLEEELVLIQAHQIYGNRWAELTKFLPGRSDNGIKNHWHSSVKKKLDSYMSCGLLDQYQAMPLAPYERNSTLQSAFMPRYIDGNGCLSGQAEEEINSCQNSNMVGCSLSARDFPNGATNMGHHFHPRGNSQENEQAVNHADQSFYRELDDISVSISEFSFDIEDCSQVSDHNISASSGQSYQFDFQELSDISMEMRHNMSEVQMPYTNESNKSTLGDSNSKLNMDVVPYTDPTNVLTPETECSRVLFPDQENEGLNVSRSLAQEPNEVDQAGCRDPCASASDSQIPEASPMQSSSSRSIAMATSGKETLRPPPLIISPDKYDKKSSGLIIHPFESEPKCTTNENGSFICIDDPSSSTCADEGTNNSREEDQSYHVSDSKKLVPMNDFASLAEDRPHSLPDQKQNVASEQHHEDMGASSGLSFPRLDLPVFNCDLLHDYSPLGIRKVLMSTVSCMSPIRLWESPTRKKTLIGTKSMLRKRTSDLPTPLSARRSEKKLETDIAASLAKDFSRLDVMFDESDNRESISGNKPSSIFSHRVPEETTHIRKSLEKAEQTCMEASVREKYVSEPGVEIVQNLSGVLSEQNTDKPLLSSPRQSVSKAEKTPVSTPKNHLHRTNKEQHCSSNLCLVISPSLARNMEGHLVDHETSNENFSIFCGTPFRRSLESPSVFKSPFYANSFLPSPRFDTDITIEDFGYIFSPGEKSYKNIGVMKQRNEHTSAMESSISSSNDDDARQKKALDKENDDPLLDLGYFFSPGERSYKNIGVMTPRTEHTSAFTSISSSNDEDARQKKTLDKENDDPLLDFGYIFSPGERSYNNNIGMITPRNEHTSVFASISSSNDEDARQKKAFDKENDDPLLVERRVLDFNDCESPIKGRDEVSSYLLKGM